MSDGHAGLPYRNVVSTSLFGLELVLADCKLKLPSTGHDFDKTFTFVLAVWAF